MVVGSAVAVELGSASIPGDAFPGVLGDFPLALPDGAVHGHDEPSDETGHVMKRLTPATFLAAGALLVAGCGSGGGGSTSRSPTPAATSSVAASEVSGSGVGLAPDTAEPAPAMTATASTAAVLDAQSTAWFDALCTQIAPIRAVQNLGGDSSGQDAARRWQAKLAALRTLSQAFSATSTTLAPTPPPTIEGGADFAEKLTKGLSTAASTLSDATDKLDAVDPTDASALAAAQPVFKINVLKAVAALQTVSQLDPAVVTAVRGIPSCQDLGA